MVLYLCMAAMYPLFLLIVLTRPAAIAAVAGAQASAAQAGPE